MIKKWSTEYSPVEKNIDLQISGIKFELPLHLDSVCVRNLPPKPDPQIVHAGQQHRVSKKVEPPVTHFNARDIVAKNAFYVCN